MAVAINLTVLPENQEDAVRATEVLSRAAAGLGFEGISVSMSINTFEPEKED